VNQRTLEDGRSDRELTDQAHAQNETVGDSFLAVARGQPQPQKQRSHAAN